MKRIILIAAIALASSCRSSTAIDPELAQRAGVPAGEDPPPSVLAGSVRLNCAIDWERDGLQDLVLVKGSGIEFSATVSPIVDGTATLKGEQQGGEYRFTSHLAKPATGTLSGVGAVEIEKLDTKVAVAVTGYSQPKGPGTPIAFRSEHMADKGIYVEFSGVARAQNGDRYAFRVNLGGPTEGRGEVTPADSNYDSRVVAKAVIIEAPTMTTVKSLTRIERIK